MLFKPRQRMSGLSELLIALSAMGVICGCSVTDSDGEGGGVYGKDSPFGEGSVEVFPLLHGAQQRTSVQRGELPGANIGFGLDDACGYTPSLCSQLPPSTGGGGVFPAAVLAEQQNMLTTDPRGVIITQTPAVTQAPEVPDPYAVDTACDREFQEFLVMSVVQAFEGGLYYTAMRQMGYSPDEADRAFVASGGQRVYGYPGGLNSRPSVLIEGSRASWAESREKLVLDNLLLAAVSKQSGTAQDLLRLRVAGTRVQVTAQIVQNRNEGPGFEIVPEEIIRRPLPNAVGDSVGANHSWLSLGYYLRLLITIDTRGAAGTTATVGLSKTLRFAPHKYAIDGGASPNTPYPTGFLETIPGSTCYADIMSAHTRAIDPTTVHWADAGFTDDTDVTERLLVQGHGAFPTEAGCGWWKQVGLRGVPHHQCLAGLAALAAHR